MAKARIIVKRRKAVRNIRKITKVMQMISTSRYQKAYKRAVGTKPYVKKIGELVASAVQAVKSSGAPIDHPLLKEAPPGSAIGKVAVLVITSNRGLCGGYNGNLLRLANATIKEIEATGQPVELHVAGKKGAAYFKFNRREITKNYGLIGETPKYAEIEKVAEDFMKSYTEGVITRLKIVYMRFLSAGQQRSEVMDILPLSGLAGVEETAPSGEPASPAAAFDFMPAPHELLKELIPTTVKIIIFQAFIEAAVSEQIARMVAMKAATDSADKIGKKLTQEYNRARQSQITSELSELMGGVEAMK
ncbi:MAG TPA: ATP synthase F1 subunit gamma [Phycisphaerae bacterium]|nr:ATP synthase F1 subunit gamma [Phycisphaerae bacterium]